jgi:hypothetical protein
MADRNIAIGRIYPHLVAVILSPAGEDISGTCCIVVDLLKSRGVVMQNVSGVL